MRQWVFLLMMIFAVGTVFGEARVWEDRDGNRYEGELVRELFDKITLRLTDGSEIRLAVDEFSEHDQKYIRVKVPPVVDVNVSKKTRIKPKPVEVSDDDNDVVRIICAFVRIDKVSNRPFTSALKAEIFLIGTEVDGDNHVLLDRFTSQFLFTQQDTYQFKTDAIEIVEYSEYTGQRRGETYLGYVVAISDTSDNIVHVETDIKWLADKVPQLRELYAQGAPSRYVRHFDRQLNRTEVPRPLYYSSRPR